MVGVAENMSPMRSMRIISIFFGVPICMEARYRRWGAVVNASEDRRIAMSVFVREPRERSPGIGSGEILYSDLLSVLIRGLRYRETVLSGNDPGINSQVCAAT